ncbi:Fe-S cluster assembly protein NifU [bacterium DOLZORAL124_64_63]|nr:MAG: Fe-S cluster assembly protein NifU [bacterium DOLZORAL124_64_63]
MWNYSDKVFDHFMNPRNVGEVENPDGVGEVGSMACGDALRLSFRLDDAGCIAEAKFQTFGCGSAIASSSVLTEMLIGKTLDEAALITNEQIAEGLDGLPREKMHCSVMGREALEAAMIDYYKRLGRNVPCHLLQQDIQLCRCFDVKKETVREAIFNHRLETIEDVTNHTKAGGGCASCHHDIADLLRDCWDKIERGEDTGPTAQPGTTSRTRIPVPEGGGGLQTLGVMPTAQPPAVPVDHKPQDADMVARIQEVIDQDISLKLQGDGGDIEFVRYLDGRVYVRLTGACAACRSSEVTIRNMVEAQLREFISEDIQVIEVDG